MIELRTWTGISKVFTRGWRGVEQQLEAQVARPA